MKTFDPREEQVDFQHLHGEVWKALICPYGHHIPVDLRVSENSEYNIRHGNVAIFNTKEEAQQAVDEYKSKRP